MKPVVHIKKSTRSDKKMMVIVTDKEGTKTVHFGARGYSDYTIHKDKERMERYVARHNNGRENWTISGLKTAGFWARWVLWSKPNLDDAIAYTSKKFDIKIVKK